MLCLLFITFASRFHTLSHNTTAGKHKDSSYPRKFTKLRKKVALLKTVLCLSALPFQMLSQHFMLSVKVLQDNLSSKKYRKITVAKS